jgi:hypothetical protein
MNVQAAYNEAYESESTIGRYAVPMVDGKPWTVSSIIPTNVTYEVRYYPEKRKPVNQPALS